MPFQKDQDRDYLKSTCSAHERSPQLLERFGSGCVVGSDQLFSPFDPNDASLRFERGRISISNCIIYRSMLLQRHLGNAGNLQDSLDPLTHEVSNQMQRAHKDIFVSSPSAQSPHQMRDELPVDIPVTWSEGRLEEVFDLFHRAEIIAHRSSQNT